jgi:signal transduction histidine kinase
MGLAPSVLLLAAFANTLLAALVYYACPNKRVSRRFGAFALAVAVWTASVAIAYHLAPDPLALTFARLAFASAALSVYFLLAFLAAFPSALPTRSPLPILLFRLFAAIFVVVSLSPWLAVSVSLDSRGLHATYGQAYYPYAGFIVASIAYTFVSVRHRLRVSQGLDRLQLHYVSLGLLIPLVLATITNLLVPLTLHTSRVSHYGPIFSLPMLLVMAHTIIRHRLMNITVFISRGAAYILTILVSASLFVFLLVTVRRFFTPATFAWPGWYELAMALIVATAFQPLKAFIQDALNRYLRRHTYDYQLIVRRASTTIPTLLDLPSLFSYLSDLLTHALSAEFLLVYAADANGDFRRQVSAGPALLRKASPLPQSLQSSTPRILDELRASGGEPALVRELARLRAQVAVPIRFKDSLLAFLLLGPKRSGDPYYREDIDLLCTIAGQSSIAIRNAHLYRTVTEINDYIQSIIATIDSGVIAVDRIGQITLLNRAASNIVALPPSPSLVRSLSSIPSVLRLQLAGTLADGRPRLHVESVLSRADHSTIPVMSSCTPIRQVDGAVTGAVIIFTDLTTLKELETEKRRAERLASLGALASGLAHEIKNPLVAIRTFAELLPERFSDNEFRDSFAQVALTEIERIDDLVARLRSLAATQPCALSPLDLRDALDATLLLLRGQLDQRRIQVLRHFPTDPTYVAADFAQLKQLFLNIFLNAIEAMDIDGSLSIAVTPNHSSRPPQVTVAISDSGHGISPAILDAIFDPFVTTKPNGTGLGLAICRSIADAHTATIRATNNHVTSGATITVVFPLVTQPAHVLL